MNTLQKDKAKIRQVIKDYKLPHKLYTEEIIAIIYRFTRKSKGECYYSAKQFGEICYMSYKPVQTLLKLLEEKELINIKRRYNSSNVITMTPKLFKLLESDTVSEQSDKSSDPAGHDVQLTLSKEREKGTKKKTATTGGRSFRNNSVWQEGWDKYQGYPNQEEMADRYAKFKLHEQTTN